HARAEIDLPDTTQIRAGIAAGLIGNIDAVARSGSHTRRHTEAQLIGGSGIGHGRPGTGERQPRGRVATDDAILTGTLAAQDAQGPAGPLVGLPGLVRIAFALDIEAAAIVESRGGIAAGGGAAIAVADQGLGAGGGIDADDIVYGAQAIGL